MEKLKCILFVLSLLAQMGLGIYCIFNPAIAPACVGVILVDVACLVSSDYIKEQKNGKSDK